MTSCATVSHDVMMAGFGKEGLRGREGYQPPEGGGGFSGCGCCCDCSGFCCCCCCWPAFAGGGVCLAHATAAAATRPTARRSFFIDRLLSQGLQELHEIALL